MHDKKRWIVTLVALAVVACGAACGSSGSRPEAAEPPAPADAPSPVPTPEPAAQTADRNGSEILSVLTVEHEVDVTAEEGGVVESILHDAGARVEKGAELAQLDDRTLRAQLAHDQDNLVVAKDNVQYLQAELKSKQANYRRYQELRKSGLSSEADLEKARFEAEGAQYDLASERAIVKRTESEIRIAELKLAKTQIRAPFNGVVARRFIREGQAIAKGDRCFRVTQLRPLEVRFPVPESSSRTPRAGDRVRVALAGKPNRVYAARVLRVGPVVDPATGSWDVLAELVGRLPADLRPGMAVEVEWPPKRSPR